MFIKNNKAKEKQKKNSKMKKTVFIAIFFAALVVFVVYFPGLWSTAKNFDDDQYFYNNPLVRNPGLGSIVRFFSEILHPSTVGGYYQPMSMLSLMMDVAMGAGEQSLWIFHMTSLLIHIANVILIILILYMLFDHIYIAAFAGILFGVHPMTVEAVVWVGERKTPLAAFFGYLCILFYILYVKNEKYRKYLRFSLISFIFSILAKPTTLALPLGLLLLDYWPLNRLSRKSIKNRFFEKMSFFIVMAISTVIAFISQRNTGGVLMPGGERTALWTLSKVFYNIAFYPYKMLFPVKLSSHYPIPQPLSLSTPMVFSGIIISALVVLLMIITFNKTRALIGGWMYFWIIIFPALGIIGFNDVIASDKYAYFAWFGFLMLLVSGCIRIYDKLKSRWKDNKALPAVIITLILLIQGAYAVATRNYLPYWQNTEKLTRYMLDIAPNAGPLHYNLAQELKKQDRVDESIVEYKKTIELRPEISFTYTNLAIAHADKGEYDLSIKTFKQSVAINSSDYLAWNNMGIAYIKKQEYENAIDSFEKALSFQPDNFNGWYNLANCYKKEKKTDLAISSYKHALMLEPGAVDVLYDAGEVYEESRKYQEALNCYLQVKKMSPSYEGIDSKITAMKKLH